MKKSLLILFFLTALSANAQFWTEKSTGFTTATRGLGDSMKYKVYGLVGFIVREDTIQLIEKNK